MEFHGKTYFDLVFQFDHVFVNTKYLISIKLNSKYSFKGWFFLCFFFFPKLRSLKFWVVLVPVDSEIFASKNLVHLSVYFAFIQTSQMEQKICTTFFTNIELIRKDLEKPKISINHYKFHGKVFMFYFFNEIYLEFYGK